MELVHLCSCLPELGHDPEGGNWTKKEVVRDQSPTRKCPLNDLQEVGNNALGPVTALVTPGQSPGPAGCAAGRGGRAEPWQLL